MSLKEKKASKHESDKNSKKNHEEISEAVLLLQRHFRRMIAKVKCNRIKQAKQLDLAVSFDDNFFALFN